MCISCHNLGEGEGTGPDLKDIAARRDKVWLKRFILEPDKMLEEKDPIAIELLQKYDNVPMPNLGLTEAEVELVMAYLIALSSEAGNASTKTQTRTSAKISPGDAQVGKGLFTGSIRFQNGGSSCLACHNIVGISALGGGNLGPDLTHTYKKYGEKGIASVLASLPFPSMIPIYNNHPLTSQEQADLKAFLKQTVTGRPEKVLTRLLVFSVIGMLALFFLSYFIWRNRLTDMRRSLKSR